MKRMLSLFLVLVMCAMCFVVPAYAEESTIAYSPYTNVAVGKTVTKSNASAQKVRQLHALWGESRYERMAWGSGIGHVVIILQGQGKESIALYDRPVWEEKQDMRKVFFCRDVYGEESACRYSCFLHVYRLLQNLLISGRVQG